MVEPLPLMTVVPSYFVKTALPPLTEPWQPSPLLLTPDPTIDPAAVPGGAGRYRHKHRSRRRAHRRKGDAADHVYDVVRPKIFLRARDGGERPGAGRDGRRLGCPAGCDAGIQELVTRAVVVDDIRPP